MHHDTGTAPTTGVAKAHRTLALIVVLLVFVQVYLAGLIVFGGTSPEPHKGLGHAMELVALVLVILAFVGRRPAVQPSILLLVLIVLQNVLAQADADAISALHTLNALFILGTAFMAAAGRPLKRRGPAGAGPRNTEVSAP